MSLSRPIRKPDALTHFCCVPMRPSMLAATQDMSTEEQPPPKEGGGETEDDGAMPHPSRLNAFNRLYYYYLTYLMTRDKHSPYIASLRTNYTTMNVRATFSEPSLLSKPTQVFRMHRVHHPGRYGRRLGTIESRVLVRPYTKALRWGLQTTEADGIY